MSNVRIDFDNTKPILSDLKTSIETIERSFGELNSSINNIPNEIKSQIIGDFNSISSKISNLKTDCNSTFEAVNKIIHDYYVAEFGEEEYSTFLEGGLTSLQSGSLIRADLNFFEKQENGKIIDEYGYKYYLIEDNGYTYKYNIKTGRLEITKDGIKKAIPVGIFIPNTANENNYSKLDTITFLGGTGEQYESKGLAIHKENPWIKKMLEQPSSNAIIIPQKITRDLRYNFSNEAFEVAQSTRFTQLLLNQDSNCTNSIAGISAGGIDAYHIAENEGNEIYDNIYSFNGFPRENYKNIQDKNIFMFIANKGLPVNGVEGAGIPFAQKNLEYMNEAGYKNVIVATSDTDLIKTVNNFNNSNIKLTELSINDYNGHRGSMLNAAEKINLFNCKNIIEANSSIKY